MARETALTTLPRYKFDDMGALVPDLHADIRSVRRRVARNPVHITNSAGLALEILAPPDDDTALGRADLDDIQRLGR